MDGDSTVPDDGIVEDHQEYVHEQLVSVNGTTEIAGQNWNLKAHVNSDDSAINNARPKEVGEQLNVIAESNSSVVSKEWEGKARENLELSKQQKGQGKSKGEKLRMETLLKKSKDGKEVEALFAPTPTSTSTENSCAMHPLKSRSFSDKQDAGSNSSRVLNKARKSPSAQSNSHPLKPDGASSSTNTMQSEGHMEKTKKPMNNSKADGNTESTFSAKAAEAKTHKMGTLPAYSFSFRCDERAERRREFNSKLEDKIHAKEAEKSTLQAKSKESQEAEIKMLRKSLTFKATPMPSFYQEPPPPKVELKKTPPTRAKSPKFGRKKGLPAMDSEENGAPSRRPDRPSLDEKISHCNPPKGISPVQPKKPLRKSLPKLPSEKTKLSSSSNGDPPIQKQEAVTNSEPSETQPNKDNATGTGEQSEPALVEEPIADQAKHTLVQKPVSEQANPTLVQEPVAGQAECTSVQEPVVAAEH